MPTADGQGGFDREARDDAPQVPAPIAHPANAGSAVGAANAAGAAGASSGNGSGGTTRQTWRGRASGALERTAGRLAVRGWGGRRAERMRRLGMFFRQLRAQNHQTLEEVAADSERDGEPASLKQIWSIEQLANPAKASTRREVSFFTVWYLAQRWGKSLGDLELYLLSGEDAAASETQAARANALRAAYLGLSPQRQRQAMEFMDFLANLDEQRRTEDTAPVAADHDMRNEAARAVALADSESFLDGLVSETRQHAEHAGRGKNGTTDDPGRSGGRRRRQQPAG